MFTFASSETRTKFPIHHKKIIKKTISRALVLPWFYLFFLVMGASFYQIISEYLGAYTFPVIGSSILALYIISIIFTYFYEVWYFQTYYYEISEDFIVIRKGVFSTREVTIPFDRIQDVYVDQDILDRMFGLYDVHISSATISSGWLAHIDGVEQTSASGLKEIILQKLQRKNKNNGLTK